MAKYDNDELIELCAGIDLLEYASQCMEFERRGDGYATHCPLHVDATPSLVITPKKNLFHCFSCGCGGNILNWIMTFEKKTFNEAVEKIAKISGVDIKRLKQCDALAFYKSMCRANDSEKEVRLQRKILSESKLAEYRNEAPQEWIDEGIYPEIMKQYNIRIDDKANRIVYPVYDAQLNLIGIKGRTRYKKYKEMKLQKYQNYQKIGTTDFFVGMKENLSSIIEHNEAIIFEGIKSGMKVSGWGYTNWLSSETGWLNDDQIVLLIKMKIKNVVIAYDNDVPYKKILDCTKWLKRFVNVYVVRDRHGVLGSCKEKMSPCDKGEDIWNQLYRERVKI